MPPPSLDPREIQRLREMAAEDKLRLAFGLTEMVEELEDAGRRHRATQAGPR